MTADRAVLEDVVALVWARRTADGTPEWMRGLGASDTCRQLGPAVASRWLGLAAPTPSGQGRRGGPVTLDPEDAVKLESWLGGSGWELVRELCTVARRLKDRTVLALRDAGAVVVPRAVGSWALTAVGDRHRRFGGCPCDEDLDDVAREYRSRFSDEEPLRRMRLDEQDFLAVAAPEWDRVWPVDREIPEGERPHRYGLGADRRPPLSGRHGDWRSGTDRPVYRRYRRYFDASARAAAPGVSRDHHVTRRYPGREPSVIVLDEVRRAARPFGLDEPGHATAVVAVADALRPGRGRDHGTAPSPAEWADRDATLPVTPDADLERVVVGVAATWIATTHLAGVLGLGGADLAAAVTRRVRHVLHGREVVWDTPVSRAELVAAVRGSFDRHLRDYDASPASDGPGPPEGRGPDGPAARAGGPADPDDLPPAASDMTDVHARTIAAVQADDRRGPELLRLLVAGDERWRTHYAEIVAGVDGVLDADGFHDLALDLAEVN